MVWWCVEFTVKTLGGGSSRLVPPNGRQLSVKKRSNIVGEKYGRNETAHRGELKKKVIALK